MAVTVFISKDCEMCKNLRDRNPDLDYRYVEEHLDEVQRLGLRAVPAKVEGGKITYGTDNIMEF